MPLQSFTQRQPMEEPQSPMSATYYPPGSATTSSARGQASHTISTREKFCVKRKAVLFSLGLPQPDLAVNHPGRAGKVTPLFQVLRPFE